MRDKPDRLYADDDDNVQMAAALAAVYAYIAAEEESAAESPPEPPAGQGWAAEALLEGLGAFKIATPLPAAVRRNPWLGAGLKFMLSVMTGAALLGFGAPVSAQWDAPLPAPPISESRGEDPLPATLLRVGVVPEAQTIALGIPDGADVCDRATGTVVARLASQGRWAVSAGADTIAFSAAGERSTASILPDGQPIRPVGFQSSAAPAATAFALKVTMPAFRATAQAPALRLEAAGMRGAAGLRANTAANVPGAAGLRANTAAAGGFTPGPGAAGYVVVPPQPDGLVAVNGRLYRGIIWIQPCAQSPGKVSAVNVVDLEDYLLSVVPAEMPSSWPMEALKAQSVVARSYALANRGKNETRGFDVKATAEDQVYSGVQSETESTNRAVAETAGLVLEHDGKPASAFFHSTSGGFTELSEFVWGTSAPFLQAVPDYDDASPHFSWSRKYSLSDLDNALSGPGCAAGEVLAVLVVSRAPSMRARQVLVVGSREAKLMGADTVRRLLKLPSTNFNVGCRPDGYEFAGRGFGHGLGMSQWGAKALAERGYNAAQILKYYYKDVALDYHEAIRLSDGRSMATTSLPGN